MRAVAAGGATLAGTTTVAAVNGVARFMTLSLDKTGAGYTLVASSPGYTDATSTAFTITPGPVAAAQSSLVAADDTVGQCLTVCDESHNEATTITVTLRDQFGNTVGGAGVALSAAPGDSTRFTGPGPSGITDADGVFTARFNSGRAAATTISAISGGTPITQTTVVTAMPVLIAAGDIADCNRLGDDATANMIDSMPGTVLALGDDAYPNGQAEDFANCYDPTWGRHKARSRPVPGDGEYEAGIAEYDAYWAEFGADLGTPGSRWYSYDLGGWHVIALDSSCYAAPDLPGCTGEMNERQMEWLKADLEAISNDLMVEMTLGEIV